MLLLLATWLVLALQTSWAFKFRHSPPVQCGMFDVQWDGGTPPFQLTLIPLDVVNGGRIYNYDMPAKGAPPYKHSVSLSFPSGVGILAIMSDATGWGSGGCTPKLAVRPSSNTSCLNYTATEPDFYMWMTPNPTKERDPRQCEEVSFGWTSDTNSSKVAHPPVHVYAAVLGGEAFEIPNPVPVEDQLTNAGFPWTVNMKAATPFLVLMTDSRPGPQFGGNGGSTKTLVVGESTNGNSSCLTGAYPRQTGAAQPELPLVTPPEEKKGLSSGAIIGIAVGGSAGAVIVILTIFLLFRHQKKKKLKTIGSTHHAAFVIEPEPDVDQNLLASSPSGRYPPTTFSTTASSRHDTMSGYSLPSEGGMFRQNAHNPHLVPYPMSMPVGSSTGTSSRHSHDYSRDQKGRSYLSDGGYSSSALTAAGMDAASVDPRRLSSSPSTSQATSMPLMDEKRVSLLSDGSGRAPAAGSSSVTPNVTYVLNADNYFPEPPPEYSPPTNSSSADPSHPNSNHKPDDPLLRDHSPRL